MCALRRARKLGVCSGASAARIAAPAAQRCCLGAPRRYLAVALLACCGAPHFAVLVITFMIALCIPHSAENELEQFWAEDGSDWEEQQQALPREASSR